MSDDVLSRSDVESLLQSLEPQAKPSGDSKKSDPKKSGAPKMRILAYDFKRPERVGKEQMRALQSLHDGFSRNLGASLSAVLRSMVEVRLISVDQLTYSEFVYSLTIPTCFNLLKPLPLEGNWVLDISPALLFPIIDRMLGGGVSGDSTLKRPLSEIELRLATRISNVFLRELQTAWFNIVEMNIEVERVESNPQLVQIVPPNEVVVMVSFELTIGQVRGMINLCIPYNTIERVNSKLTSNSWIGYASARSNVETKTQLLQRLDGSEAEVIVTLARSKIKTSDLFDLEIGDIISTEKDTGEPLEVEVSNRVKFLASAGAFKGRKAIQIQALLDKSP
ncbi:Flagellar motor switch protein FliM [Pirellula sp. SH-Sr6A]|uniref:flagellar motor switch protein FliM n=1 Tax=Pirellula sp. SH-Sr6A TaxID=1632865 RepID=UPI00078C3C8F|nr:flagellar motor switch protein FliM [Pirellula sp. SH-Sr6A]AMV35187.1 Flagellar motor switch protein FliM [Pirellula sp. SH-Sr6A]